MGITPSLSDLTGKARIRHAALALFATDGYAQTSLRAIAQEAGVSLALITHHFGSKHQLRAAVDADVVATFEHAMRVVAGAASDTDDQLGRDMADEVDRILGSRAELRAYLRRTVVVDGTTSGMVLVQTLLALMRGLFERPGAARGGGDPGWQSLQFFLLAFGPTLLEPLLHQSLPGMFAGQGSRTWHQANVQLLQFGLGGVRAAPERALRLVAASG